jgi:16S rRNA processing protein RimM
MSECKYIECAKVINTHGCHGGLKLESWCNTPEDLASLKKLYLSDGGKYVEYKVKKASVFKQFVIMDIEGVCDMDAALGLKNKIFFADRADFLLEDGEYFIADIIGLDVIDSVSGKVYGKISDVINRGASDIYVVDTVAGERMIPVVDEFIVNVDINKGVFVNVIEGLLD